MTATGACGVEVRAHQSHGISNDAIMKMVCRALDHRQISGECLADVGCGAGNLYHHVHSRFSHYVGVDAVHMTASLMREA